MVDLVAIAIVHWELFVRRAAIRHSLLPIANVVPSAFTSSICTGVWGVIFAPEDFRACHRVS
jgi:hypothetical protein